MAKVSKRARRKAVEFCAQVIKRVRKFNFTRDFPTIKEKFPWLDGRGMRYLVMDAQEKLGLPREYIKRVVCKAKPRRKSCKRYRRITGLTGVNKLSRALVGLHTAVNQLKHLNEKLNCENRALKDEADRLRARLVVFEETTGGKLDRPVIKAMREGLKAHRMFSSEIAAGK